MKLRVVSGSGLANQLILVLWLMVERTPDLDLPTLEREKAYSLFDPAE